MATVAITLPHHAYQVHIEPGLRQRLGPLLHGLAPHHLAGLFCDQAVLGLYGQDARASLEHAGYHVASHGLIPGEEQKNLDTVRELYSVLVAARLERKSPVIAMGGGVCGDTVGFAASTYLRGVPFVQCPTTLLAMVDASVGGKVGINLPEGKNLVGSFYQPVLVAIDTDTLATLPQRELRCGLAECVKHGIIRDEDLFAWLEVHLPRVMNLEPATMVELVRWNVQIKANVVMADEKETGERAHLNFGHTFAHAIEATAGYGQYHHGEAVALGMVAATELAVRQRRCAPELLPRLQALLQRIGLPIHAADLVPIPQLLDAMRLDKKVAGGKIRLVLPTRLGAVTTASDATDAAIAQAWQAIGAA